MTTKRAVPCGEPDGSLIFPDGVMRSFVCSPYERPCGTNGAICFKCSAYLYALYTAESDQTPADAEWLESIGWEKTMPAGMFLLSPCQRLAFQVKERGLLHGVWKELLIPSPTRGNVLKLLAALGDPK